MTQDSLKALAWGQEEKEPEGRFEKESEHPLADQISCPPSLKKVGAETEQSGVLPCGVPGDTSL